MADRTSGTNGSGAPTGSQDGRGSTSAYHTVARIRSPNAVRPSPVPERIQTTGGADKPRRRGGAARRAREEVVPAGERTRGDSATLTAEREVQRAPANSIRPSLRRSRAAETPGQGRLSADREREQVDQRTVPDEVKQRFVQVGNKYHFPDGTRAFTDHGNRLTSPSENTEVIKSLIVIAQARGWSDITISGTERFRKEAWFAARLAGLDVRGYSPTEFEQSRLVRALARDQAPAERSQLTDTVRAAPSRSRDSAASGDEGRSDVRGPVRERSRTLQVGKLVDHGSAPYLHDPRNDMSYFVRIETPAGEREFWGVDLERALKESLTRPQAGDEIGLRAVRREAVNVRRSERDTDGRVIGETRVDAHRNGWIIEKREFLKERAQAARVLRDASVDQQHAVKRHPELLGTYLQLHAAELVAKTIRDPGEQRRFVAGVRTALADAVARGEPLPTVPLKESAAKRPGPRAAGPERDMAPVR
jgi:hypothetical protein